MEEPIIIPAEPIRDHALYRRDSAYPAFVGTRQECISMRRSWSHKALREGWTLTRYNPSSPWEVRADKPSPAQRIKNFILIFTLLACFWVVILMAALS